MRYSQYKTINELSESLNEALVYVADTKNYALLEDCLMAMTAISDVLLNESGKEADKAKCILADMYKILEILDNPEDDIPKLGNLSGDLANECKTNLKYKLRILFVAELGSKWDSMKSVYEAFLERDDCDIDVVLEPIFRATQLPNGETKAEIIYDDWLTPLGINHIPYKQYDMATIQPDITFISQPYESVTVPMFWPENIAKYSKLVYLPYYAAMALNETERDSFFNMPIQGCAWRIICQSEKMKECYEKYASRQGENVLVTGLPKWDYPMSLNEENTPCPEEWKEKLAGKKVFLLNTHFNTQLLPLESETFGVINYFLRHKDIALIWRPHPMTETVKKLYHEDQYEILKEIENAVLSSPNIVIDTSTSYAPAFVWSDALITVCSSLISQYLMIDKPIAYKWFNLNIPDTGELFAYDRIPCTGKNELLEEWVNDVIAGNDRYRDDRIYLQEKYYYLAGGNVGFRVMNTILSEFSNEHGVK